MRLPLVVMRRSTLARLLAERDGGILSKLHVAASNPERLRVAVGAHLGVPTDAVREDSTLMPPMERALRQFVMDYILYRLGSQFDEDARVGQ